VFAFFLVEDFFMADFFVTGAVDFLVVEAVEELVVVIDSFLLAQDDIKKPTATRAVMEQIRDCFMVVLMNAQTLGRVQVFN
jgi:hypothetical protein